MRGEEPLEPNMSAETHFRSFVKSDISSGNDVSMFLVRYILID